MSLPEQDVETYLKDGVNELDLSLTPHQIQQFFLYLRELQKWNRRINLTGKDDDLTIIRHHFVDSLSCLRSDLITPGIRLLDIGTGAGFPAIPLKIFQPDISVTAVDAVTKKILFVRQLCRVLDLHEVDCLAVRLVPGSQPLAPLSGRPFDVIVSRAVGSVSALVELALPYLAAHGRIVLQRGQRARRECGENTEFFRQKGLNLCELRDVEFSFFASPRCLLILRRQ